ncbi:uncharacterized protein [Clytia hemisphaerica]|uniref:Ubiquitin-like protease family profile domain-containing protein n=1 Tax=Clytia hemisphaerica TaxID=252671 RepID=A0A7M5UN07_9CNID
MSSQDLFESAFERIVNEPDRNILMVKIGAIEVKDVDLKSLGKGKLKDNVIQGFIPHLLSIYDGESKVGSIDCTVLGQALSFPSTYELPGSVKNALREKETVFGIYNKNDHWNLLLIFPKQKQLWLANPTGEGTMETENVVRTWESVMASNFNESTSWTMYSQQHAVQEDAVSCGVFCLKFLESFLQSRTLPSKGSFGSKDVLAYRQKIGLQLLRSGGDDTWTGKLCRICGREDPPKCNFSSVPKLTNWVECENCIPKRWFHLLCLGSDSSAEKEMSFDCNKEIKVAAKLSLKEGQLLLKRRTNKRIKVCGKRRNGCTKGDISKLPLESPKDLIFMKKERRPKRDKHWSSVDENDYVMAYVHYHIECAVQSSNNIVLAEDVNITEEERVFLNGKGFIL